MNHSELVRQLARMVDLTATESEKKLSELISILTSELSDGKTVTIMNFGSLEVKKRNERISIHPATGKKILVPPKLVVKFKPSVALTQKIKMLGHE